MEVCLGLHYHLSPWLHEIRAMTSSMGGLRANKLRDSTFNDFLFSVKLLTELHVLSFFHLLPVPKGTF